MLLLIRYDWRNKEYQPSEADAPRQVVARVRVECDRLEAAVRANPTNPDFDGGYLAAVRHVRAVASGRSSWEGDGR